jgi:tRNA1(Val) A37 N6-methylase TrmN6
LHVSLVEIDPLLVWLARRNAENNGFADRVRAILLDATAPARVFAEAGLPPGCAARVLMNPPFHPALSHRASPDPARARARAAAPATLAAWCATAARLLVPGGVLTLIWRADGLGEVLHGLDRFGGVALLPVHPRDGVPAIRILVRAVKGSRAPLQLLAPLTLTDATGRPTAAAEAVLRDAASLPLAGSA